MILRVVCADEFSIFAVTTGGVSIPIQPVKTPDGPPTEILLGAQEEQGASALFSDVRVSADEVLNSTARQSHF
jgi:hypothetical protein